MPYVAASGENNSPNTRLAPHNIIVVNSPLSGPSNSPGITTLSAALLQAIGDPQDNEIVFAPTVFCEPNPVIQLTAPLLVAGLQGGHNRIDGRLPNGRIVLDVSPCPDAGIILCGDGRLSLANLILRGGNKRTILLKDRSHLVCDHLHIEGASGPGLALFQRATAQLFNCRIADHLTHGIELHDQGILRIDNSRITTNRQSGIAGFGRVRIEARQCRIEHNGDWNMVLKQESQAHLIECQLGDCRFANIDLSGLASLQTHRCVIRNGERFGLFATDCPTIQLIDTELSHHNGRGIEMQGEGRLSLIRVQIESCGDYGAILFGRSAIEAIDSVVLDNAAHGVCLHDQATGRFERCRFVQNRFSGIGCADDGEGGTVQVRQCLFQGNVLRPIYRGPLHIDPLVPTPLSIRAPFIECVAEPRAEIELFLDRVGEAEQYLTTMQADSNGRFTIDSRLVPEGYVMTATATTHSGATSEFNVIAGHRAGPIISALLGKTGPLSDEAVPHVETGALLRRWRPGSHLILQLEYPIPTSLTRTYAEYLVRQTKPWTAGAITAELREGESKPANHTQVVIPVSYVPASYPDLIDRGGVIYMRWDTRGLFVEPMRILLADGADNKGPCPRILAHEWGHALGLYHARVGLLSRMQGSRPPPPGLVNDFSPTLTYYDVLALHMLYHQSNQQSMTLGQLANRGVMWPQREGQLVRVDDSNEPIFSPRPPPLVTPASPR
ncbi:MAG: hypothetical protein GXY44_00765 [Phycisphaerales bacterium]|nr:hypothetical protein [Phycisphaerales bacterium]